MTLLTIIILTLSIAANAMDHRRDPEESFSFQQQKYIALPRNPNTRLSILDQRELQRIYEQQQTDPNIHIERRVFELTIATYPVYLQHLFALVTRGYKIDPRVDQPNWIIWTHPQIISTGREVQLSLLKRDLSHGAVIGSIPTEGDEHLAQAAIETCRNFIKQTTSAEEPLLSFSAVAAAEEAENTPYWTAIDGLLLRLVQGMPTSVSSEDKIQIFLNWRALILQFLIRMQGNPDADRPMVGDMFRDYLLERLHILPERAEFFAHFMDMRHYNILKGMSPFNFHDERHVDVIYDKFLEGGIFPSVLERDLSRVMTFWRETDLEIWGPPPTREVKPNFQKFPANGGCRDQARDFF